MDEIIIRKATREDMKACMQMITDLAAFEGYPDGPAITHKDLERDGFDLPNPLFYIIVAECPKTKKLVGQAMYNFAYSSWGGPALYLEDIYVNPAFRSKNIGHKLFSELCRVAYEHKCCRIDWHVLVENDRAIKFYRNHGAIDICAKEKRTCLRIYDTKIFENCSKL